MRLINTETGDFEEFVDLSTTPPYAILSHTWNRPPVGEQSYQDVAKIQERYRTSSPSTGERLQATTRSASNAEIHLSPLELHISDQPISPTFQIPQPSSSMFMLVGCFLISILARAALCFLLGSSVAPPRPEHRNETQTPPSTVRGLIWHPDSGLCEKIRKACEIARQDGYGYIWIDSSCIDKTSSSELSEAINSMFTWYGGAQICYAFLSDVPSTDDMRARRSKFRSSRWFTRAWTLQELIAPRVVVFLSQDWQPIGTKDALADLIQEVTYIDRQTLTHGKALVEESVAERMRWASKRKATRVEDRAYSLLGIFGITMPPLYGEGAHAFQRLQAEILQRIPDQSLFAWADVCRPIPEEPSKVWIFEASPDSPFASSPRSFNLSKGRIVPASGHKFESLRLPIEEYTPTPYGLRTQLCIVPVQAVAPSLSIAGSDRVVTWYLAILACQDSHDRERLLSRLCYTTDGPKYGVELLHIPSQESGALLGRGSYDFIFTISLDDLVRAKASMQLRTTTVYLPSPGFSNPERLAENITTSAFRLSLPRWAQIALQHHGFTVSDLRHANPTKHPSQSQSRSRSQSQSHSLTLTHTSFNIHIHYRHILIGDIPHAMALEARMWVLSPDSDENAVQNTPAYTSAIWVTVIPWEMNLPLRRVDLIAPTGEQVVLRLSLSLASPSQAHYHIHIEVAPSIAQASANISTRAVPEPLSSQLDMWQKDLRLTMLGSVHRALEMRGFSVRFEGPRHPLADAESLHSYSLELFNASSEYTIFIKYFHAADAATTRPAQLVIVARITVESSTVTTDDSERYQDGPYIVTWRDMGVLSWCLGSEQVTLNTPTGDSLTLRLGLDLAWQSEYYVLADVDHLSGSLLQGPGNPKDLYESENDYCVLHEPHSSIILTLPEQARRALLAQGYEVYFRRSHEHHLDSYHLTLSDTHLTVEIHYFYDLSTRSDGKQTLTFRACIKPVFSQSPGIDPGLARPDDSQTVEWDAWRPESWYSWGVMEQSEGWYWEVPQEDVELMVPTGFERLILRLGFDLVWLGEYCITVDVVSQPASTHTFSPEYLLTPSAAGTKGKEDDGGTRTQKTEGEEPTTPGAVALNTTM